jgi:hypothetical protein
MIAWIEASGLATALQSIPWGFPIAEALHFVGLCLLMGSLAVIDLRLLGFTTAMSARAVHQLLPWAWIGFGINAITGLFFFLSNPSFYYPNTSFRIKLVLILLAGANALWFELTVNRNLDRWPEGSDFPTEVKVMASSSLVLWIAVICFGRFIMYWPPF